MLLNLEPNENWFTWIARKTHKSVFSGSKNRPHSSPLTNTPGLYDGSAEARAILQGAIDAWENSGSETFGADYIALGSLGNALDYLKGRDMQGRFSYTVSFFGPTLAEWTEQLNAEAPKEKPELVQISPVIAEEIVAEPKKDWGWAHPRVVEEDGSFEPTPPSC